MKGSCWTHPHTNVLPVNTLTVENGSKFGDVESEINFIFVCVSLLSSHAKQTFRKDKWVQCLHDRKLALFLVESFLARRKNREIEQKPYSFRTQHHLPSSAVGGAMKIRQNEYCWLTNEFGVDMFLRRTHKVTEYTNSVKSIKLRMKKKTHPLSSIDYDANMKENMCTFFS